MRNFITQPLVCLAVLCLWIAVPMASVRAECPQQTLRVVMATPASSRISRTGDALQAVLQTPLQLSTNNWLPSGTIIYGHIASVKPSSSKEAGRLKLLFTRYGTARFSPFPFMAATGDGWLHQENADTSVWHLALDRSTRMLNNTVRARLGPDPSVWAQILGLNTSGIPDVSTDEFIWDYHRREVLIGAGDVILLRPKCY